VQVSDVVVEPYNTVLTLHHLIEDVDLVDILDNKQLYDIYTRTLKVPSPTLNDLNKLGATRKDISFLIDTFSVALHVRHYLLSTISRPTQRRSTQARRQYGAISAVASKIETIDSMNR
jgi:hypothetical protein